MPKQNDVDVVIDASWSESLADNVEGKRSSSVKRRKDSMRKIKSSVNRMIDTLTKTRLGMFSAVKIGAYGQRLRELKQYYCNL